MASHGRRRWGPGCGQAPRTSTSQGRKAGVETVQLYGVQFSTCDLCVFVFGKKACAMCKDAAYARMAVAKKQGSVSQAYMPAMHVDRIEPFVH